MNTFDNFYTRSGQLLFWTSLPLIRLFIKRTHRVYCVIRYEEEILFVKNWLSDGLWALPGGGIKRSEDASTALARELREELGMAFHESDFRHIASGKWQNHKLGFGYDIFELSLKSKILPKSSHEITASKWLNPTAINISNSSIDIVKVFKPEQ
ncbi:MAG TPA: NUDIX hydrolase [Candidatus Saccharimonadales bacterium]|nr:NUDIX hydrolase [Candidatus Saccharimonadales bacterium]